jgi:hypothetical protein
MNSLLYQPSAIPISLGWHCHVALFIQDLGDIDKIRYDRNVFDWFGIPMWSICELIEKGFADLTSRTLLEERKRYTTKKDKILSHLTYDIRFLHEFKPGPVSTEDWRVFEEKYTRRVERFYQTLKFSKDTGRKLLFFRVQQDLHNKIIYPEFPKQTEQNELFYVKKFADQLKAEGVIFQIVFFTESFPMGYDAEHNIVSVQYKKANPDVQIGADQLMAILKANLPFVQRCLRVIT